jgi:hypothetical protein
MNPSKTIGICSLLVAVLAFAGRVAAEEQASEEEPVTEETTTEEITVSERPVVYIPYSDPESESAATTPPISIEQPYDNDPAVTGVP